MMKLSPRIASLVVTAIMLLLFNKVWCQYHDYGNLSEKIRDLGNKYPEICSVSSIAKTLNGRDIWLITVGKGNRDQKPGIFVAGGIDGRFILGRELALGVAEKITQNSRESEIQKLLDKITFYIIPDVNPDATNQFFSGKRYERNLNSRSSDDDRDFANDEDPNEDLNNDGLITQIRIKDPAGEYIESDEDKRVMVQTEISKGQAGMYQVYSEGVDNDKDGKFNEDGIGGVNFNHNFTFNYEEFGPGAGIYPVSEIETRAVADFLFDHFNIYAVFSFGPQDNLGQPLKATEKLSVSQNQNQQQPQEQGMIRRERGRITSILNSDEQINKFVSDKYHEITGAKGSPISYSDPGNFMEWAYYHYGRYSFSTPGWWFPVENGKNTEAAFLKYAEKNNLRDVFVPWTNIEHPDFPDKSVEVGGIKPFSIMNPPDDTIADLIDKHYRFIAAIAGMNPELEFLDTRIENAGENLFRLTLKVHNKGIFSTCAEIGEPNIWTRIMRISVEPSKGQTIMSGLKVQRLKRLEGNESAEFSWLISGKGVVDISAGSVNVVQTSARIELK